MYTVIKTNYVLQERWQSKGMMACQSNDYANISTEIQRTPIQ